MINTIATSHPTLLPAVVAAAGSIFAAIIGLINRLHIRSVKILVNGRLDQALKDIAMLKAAHGVPQRRELDDNELHKDNPPPSLPHES